MKIQLVLLLFLPLVACKSVEETTGSWQPEELHLSYSQVQEISDFFEEKKKGNSPAFPVSISRKNFYVFSFYTGIHEIEPRSDESMIQFEVWSSQDQRYRFKFTSKPKIYNVEASSTQDIQAIDYLNSAIITQYKISVFTDGGWETIRIEK